MKVPVFLLFYSVQILSAQSILWTENFDNQYVPSYFEGNISRFTILNKKLYLNHLYPAAQNETQIIRYSPVKYGDRMEWEMQISLDFSPSLQNNLKFYLASTHPNLNFSEDAWYIQVGGESGNQDKLSLYRQKNNVKILLAASAPGLFTGSTFSSTLRISLTDNGFWTISTKSDSIQPWQISLTYKSAEMVKSFYTGLLLTYTASRARHFSFDSWKMDGLLPDISLPVVDRWMLLSPNQLSVIFSKPLDSITNKQKNFNLRNVEGNVFPLSGHSVDTLNPYILSVYFDSIPPNKLYHLKGTVTDKSKNENIFQISFLRKAGTAAKPGDLLFTEILAAPLKDKQAEFIEIYNRSAEVLQLSLLKILVNKNLLKVPEIFISPGEYILFHHIRDSLYFKNLKNSYGLSGFPPLPNTYGNIEIFDGDRLLDNMQYGNFPDWMQTIETGKSIEKRRLEITSACILNWTNCKNEWGHSMGNTNWAFTIPMPDFEPVADHIFPKSVDTLQFFASVPLKKPEKTDMPLFSLMEVEIGSLLPGTYENEWIISLKSPVIAKKTYAFTLLKGLKNCLGQENGEPQLLRFAIPEKPGEGEKIFVSEILFDPLSFQKPFLEIQANTNHPIDLRAIHWGSSSEEKYPHRVLFPGEPYAISENPAALIDQYGYTADKGHILFGTIPALNRSIGNLSLFYDGNEKDIVNYDKRWHSPWLKSTTGVSLERKGGQLDGQLASSWSSAAGFRTGASPGKKNTSAGKEESLMKGTIALEPISFNSTSQIQTCLLSSTYLGSQLNIRIFDTFGNEVKYLIKNQILGNDDEIYWDGKNNLEENLLMGKYIWWIEILQASGERHIFKLVSNLE
ncbi:MAG: hypothetical protein ACKOZZ_04385 [Bacteroidota bacterium]